MTIELLSDLLLKHLQGTLTEPEKQLLDRWVEQSSHNRHLFHTVSDESQLKDLMLLLHPDVDKENEQAIYRKIQILRGVKQTKPGILRSGHFRKWIWAAASVLLIAGISAFFWFSESRSKVVTAGKDSDLLPGKQGAILTLANGRQVVLDSLGNGVIASENGAQVVLDNNGLAYNGAGDIAGTPVYNILSTPRGRQFQLTLPDGTKAWLNAASSLRYPTFFSGGDRRVEVTGEVYFEIAEDASKPFRVSTGKNADVLVLGTHFNINSYGDGGLVETTLLQGSIRVLSGQSALTLSAGEQAQSKIQAGAASDAIKLVRQPDIDKIMAWKNGLFNFEGATLEEVLRQLERWYDIEVEYEKQVPDIRFGGKLSRDMSLAGLLKSLEESEVHFKIKDGRKLIVLP